MVEQAARTTIPTCVGRSYDGRTNRWRVTCPKCGNAWEPQTTMRSKQELQCPRAKCGAEMMADYNNNSVTLIGGQASMTCAKKRVNCANR